MPLSWTAREAGRQGRLPNPSAAVASFPNGGPEMNAATFLVRSTALVGVGSTLCWTIGFAWDTVREPPLLGLTVVAALPTSAVVVLANRQRPGILAVPDETEFPRLLLRLSVAGFVSYAALWAIIIAVGMTLLWMFPPDAGSEARVGVAILAW